MNTGAAADEAATRLSDSQDDAAWSAQARAALNAADTRLARRFDQGDEVGRLVALRARAADHLLKET